MPQINNNFLQGKMNKDLDDRLLPNGQYRDARNVKVSKSESSNVGALQNIKGNDYLYSQGIVSIPKNFTGTIELWDTIGYYANSLEGRIYWFITSFDGDASDEILNFKSAKQVVVPHGDVAHDDDTTGHRTVEISNFTSHDIQIGMKVTGTGVASDSYVEQITEIAGNKANITLNKAQSGQTVLDSNVELTFTHTCRIYYFNTKENLIEPQVLIDSARLNLSKSHHIHHANLLGNLLFWTDNYNQPRRLNVEKTSTFYSDDAYLEDKISVAQFSPIAAPRVTMTNEPVSTVSSLHLKDKFVKFAYRFQFENKEYSLISPFTQTCFEPGYGKNENKATFANGEAGLLNLTDQVNAVKETVVESMQNRINRVKLQLDMPITADIDSDAGGQINGNTGSTTTNNVDGISGTIAVDSTIVTGRGDVGTIASSSISSGSGTITTDAAFSPFLLDNTNIYFFNEEVIDGTGTGKPPAYDNKLNVRKVEILYAESDSLALKVVDTIEINGNTEYSYRVEEISNSSAKLIYTIEFLYDSTKPIKTLPSSEITRVSDIVPLKAKAQEVSGNRVIYGNFKQNRPLTSAITKDRFDVTNGNQAKYNDSYLLQSVKSNREYSVGLVLSDRYGRQSTVFLPTASTTFVESQDPTVAVTNGQNNSWKHSCLKLDFKNTINDVYNSETNPLGWYSYKVVVKQAEQDYYNVYAPTLIDNIPSSNKRSWLTLYGDNINKVPRDVTDTNSETGTQGSKTELLPRFIKTGSAQVPQDGKNYIDVISVGTALEHGLNNTINSGNSSDPLAELYTSQKDPLLAELPDGYGLNHSGGLSGGDALVVFETKPFKTALDIYYETSTAGLLEHLNTRILAAIGSNVANIALSATTFPESTASGATIATLSSTDGSGSTISNETYTLVSVVDGNGDDRTSEFTIPSGTKNLNTAAFFYFQNRPKDNFTVRIKSTDSNGNNVEEDKSINLTNVAPTIDVGTTPMTIAGSTAAGLQIRIITGQNGSADLSNNNVGLTYSIESGNTEGKFTINNLGSLRVAGSSGFLASSYVLALKVTDAGNLSATANLTINIGASTFEDFYMSDGDTVCGSGGSNVCTSAVGTKRWHSGSGQVPESGDVIYSNSQGTSVFNGQGYCYSFWQSPHNGSGTSYYATVSTNGTVGTVNLCTT